MKTEKIQKSGLIISIALLLIIAFTFLATFQTTQAVVSHIRENSVNSLANAPINLSGNRTDRDDSFISRELFDEPEYDTTEIIGEDISKRTETSKTFIQVDGTFVMQEYGVPVHYLYDDKYLDIDNKLNESLENASNSFKVSFSDGSRENLVNISDEYGGISMMPILTETQRKDSTNIYVYDSRKNTQLVGSGKNSLVGDWGNGNETQKNLNKDQSNLVRTRALEYNINNLDALDSLNIKSDNLKNTLTNTFANHNSAVLYKNIIDDVDIQYIIEGKSLKENIIINAPLNQYIFKFEMGLEDLVPHKASNGDILITNQKGELVYIIPKGYMIDAAGIYSDSVEYQMEYNQFGNCFLTVIADEEFFASCSFPVVIDPTIITKTQSNMVVGQHHDINSNIEPAFKAEWHRFLGIKTYYYYAYVNLGTQNIAEDIGGKIVLSADLTISYDNINSTNFEPMIKSNIAFSKNDPILYALPYTPQNNSTKKLSINVTTYLIDYLDKAVISIRDKNEKDTTFSNPILTIYYTEPSADYNISQDMGASGQGIVNLYTGKMNYFYEDVVIEDGYMPIDVSHIYDENFGDAFNIAHGFKLNLQQTLIKENNQFYCYTDAMGKKYYFTNEINPYNSELGLKIYQKSGYIFAIDRFGNSMIFTSGGYLTQVHQYPSTYENPKQALMLQINLETSNSPKILSVTNNRTILNFYYNSDNCLSEIRRADNVIVSLYDGEMWSGSYYLYYADKHIDLGSFYRTYFGYGDNTGTMLTHIGLETNNPYDLIYTYTSGKISNIYTYYMDNAIKIDRNVGLLYYDHVPNGYYEDGRGVSKSVVLNEDNVYRHVSFSNNDVIADYAYEMDGFQMTPLNAESNEFDYFSFIDTYGTTRDAVPIDNILTYNSTTTRPVMGGSGTNSYILSLWVKISPNAYTPEITATARNGGVNLKTLSYTFNKNLSGWQFGTIVFKNLTNVTALAMLCEDMEEVRDLRLVRLPNQPSTLQTQDMSPKYNSDKQLESIGKYNASDGTISIFTYVYDAPDVLHPEYPGVILRITEKINGVQRSKIEYGYDGNNNLESIVTYSSLTSDCIISGYYYDAFGRVINAMDGNGVQTDYVYNDDGTVTTKVFGIDTIYGGSTDISVTDKYYQGSGLLKSTNTGGTFDSNSGQLIGGIATSFDYTNFGGLQIINHNGFNSIFTYDSNKNIESISVANQQLVDYNYSQTQDLVNYANGQGIKYNYDTNGYLDNMTDRSNNPIATFGYNNVGWLTSASNVNGVNYTYNYTPNSQVSGQVFGYNVVNTYNMEARYFAAGDTGYPTKEEYYYLNVLRDKAEYNYNANGTLGGINKINTSITYGYGPNYRITSANILFNGRNYTHSYEYCPLASSVTSNMVQASDFSINNIWKNGYTYTYHRTGNIESVCDSDGNYLMWYYYDKYDRLIREYNVPANRIYNYTYNNGGNITQKDEYDLSWNWVTQTLYYYDNPWKDLLTSYKVWTTSGWSSVIPVVYDAAGNPTSYMDKTMTWQNGRELASVTTGNSSAAYQYDHNGLRIRKTTGIFNNNLYFWEGNRLLCESAGFGNSRWFLYDQTGIYGFNYSPLIGSVDYIYEKNIFGDIIGIYRVSDGVKMGSYEYDAWGKILAIKDGSGNIVLPTDTNNIMNQNPFRYRSYYYDNETGFYYLQSRYYDPSIGRFINADEPSALYSNAGMTFGANLYAYCLNNPVMYTDSTGYGPFADYFSGVWDGIKATA
ncbi:MAG: RHS repeat-associated core domain-containing protein, partial [Christensenellaceae bacterium]|nr:RHS repeat-associated core domain-containing protein [Christensenellaceae bacterium]